MKFNELTEEQKAQAIENFYDINVIGFDEYALDTDYYAEMLAENGFNDIKTSFSGFGSQGDGASFVASVDLKTWMLKNKMYNKFRSFYSQAFIVENIYPELTITRTSYSHYSHENTMDIDESWDYETLDDTDSWWTQLENLENDFVKLTEMVLQSAKELAQEIYSSLENEFYYETSDEVVRETLIEKDYDFDIDCYGKVVLC